MKTCRRSGEGSLGCGMDWTEMGLVGDREVGHLFKQFNVGDIMS